MPLAEARALVASAFVASRIAKDTAAVVAEALLRAEIDGKFGHGLTRISSYAEAARIGAVDGFATPEISSRRPTALLIDAKGGFAYPALRLALLRLPAIVKQQGMGMAGVCNSHHCGVAGHFVEDAARAGMLALLVSNNPAVMATWGGKTPLLGTNPIAFAMPVKNRPPLVIDMATTSVARGLILKAANSGEAIPADWALDRDGKPTTDAAEALDGTMFPLGGVKGYGLALMVEALSAVLVGGGFSYDSGSFIKPDATHRPNAGQWLMLVDMAAFTDDATGRMAELAGRISDDGGRLPGANLAQRRQEAEAKGIKIPAHIADHIQHLLANPL